MEVFVVFLAGTGCCIFSIGYMLHRRKMLRDTRAVTATIVDYSSVTSDSYAYLYEYQVNGKMIRALCPTTVGHVSKNRIGKKIPIFYQEKNPKKFVLKYDPLTFFCWVILAAGIGLMIFAISFL